MLTPADLQEAEKVLTAPLAPTLSPAKTLEVVRAALHYAELAERYERHRANNRAAKKRYQAKERERRVSREKGAP